MATPPSDSNHAYFHADGHTQVMIHIYRGFIGQCRFNSLERWSQVVSEVCINYALVLVLINLKYGHGITRRSDICFAKALSSCAMMPIDIAHPSKTRIRHVNRDSEREQTVSTQISGTDHAWIHACYTVYPQFAQLLDRPANPFAERHSQKCTQRILIHPRSHTNSRRRKDDI